jgi:hypothetical protein
LCQLGRGLADGAFSCGHAVPPFSRSLFDTDLGAVLLLK